MNELRRLAAATCETRLPDGEGLGYRRRFMRRALSKNWEIFVPGSLSETVDGDEDAVLWNDELTVRASIFCVQREADQPEAEQTEAGLTKKVEYKRSQDGDGYILQAVAGIAAEPNSKEICVVTVWMQWEDLRPCGEQIVQSLRFVGR